MENKPLSLTIRLLERLVLVDSGTENVAGVNAVQDIISERLEGLGFEIQRIPNPKGSSVSADLLVAEKKGATSEWITLVSHADTVFEKGAGFSGFKIDSQSKFAIGPGVIDNKGGVVVALSALESISSQSTKYSYRFVVSPNEELGSIGFHERFKEIGLNSSIILGFEPAFEDGSFVNRRQGNRWYNISIVGREAHSGRAHAYGVNAAHELALKISKLHDLTNYEAGQTLSVGYISGGKNKYNVVCGEAKAKLDLRFEDPVSVEKLHEKIVEILTTSYVRSGDDSKMSTQCSFKIADDCPPYKNNSKSDQIAKILSDLIEQEEGVRCPAPKRGAAADTSYMAHENAVVLDGLGVCGSGMHQSSERVLLSSVESRARVCAKLLAHLEQNKV